MQEGGGGGLQGKETAAVTQRLSHRPQGDTEGTPPSPLTYSHTLGPQLPTPAKLRLIKPN